LKLISADDAAALIHCGSTVASAGFLGAGHAEAITEAIERRFLRDQSPRDLTLIYSAGQGDRATRGVNHFCHRGLTRRVIGGHWRSAPGLAQLALEEGTEAYNLPQGVISQLYRAIAGRKPGVITSSISAVAKSWWSSSRSRVRNTCATSRCRSTARSFAPPPPTRWAT
jgi:propionate CoA-transferase